MGNIEVILACTERLLIGPCTWLCCVECHKGMSVICETRCPVTAVKQTPTPKHQQPEKPYRTASELLKSPVTMIPARRSTRMTWCHNTDMPPLVIRTVKGELGTFPSLLDIKQRTDWCLSSTRGELWRRCGVVVRNALEEEVSRLLLHWPLTSDHSGFLTAEEWEVGTPAVFWHTNSPAGLISARVWNITFLVMWPDLTREHM